MMSYEEAVAYIEQIPKFAKKHTIEHTKDFLRRLGNPAEERRIIHVAGTNGKGSVCAYMQAILMSEGKRTGFFTSPHLISINERIRIDNIQIDDAAFLDVFLRVRKTVDEMEAQGIAHPSYFEFLFGMAMVAFAESDVEYIILETGLGGRLDATNAIAKPLLTIITSISLDHTVYLGSTIAEVAFEKAGIIKPEVPIFYDCDNTEAADVIRKQAAAMGAPCREISKNALKIREITDKHIAFSRVNAYDEDIPWKLSNTGIYQIVNASLALAAMEYAIFGIHVGKRGKSDYKSRYNSWRDTLASVTWEGRMEEVRPGIIVDGAHNPGAVEAFVESVRMIEEYTGNKGKEALPVILFSAVADKDYDQMIAYLCRNLPAKAYVVTEVDDSRKVSAKELGRTFRRYTDKPVEIGESFEQAMKKAIDWRDKGGKLYCLGSLYLVGMVKEQLDRR